MIYVKHDNTGFVTMTHFMPFDEFNGLKDDNGNLLTREKLEETGLFVDLIPEPVVQDKKTAILYVNLATKELYYEYIDVPLTQDEEIKQLKSQNAQMLLALVEGGLL